MSMSENIVPFMSNKEVFISALRGNEIARTLKPLHPDEDFRFPFATVSIAHTSSIGDAMRFAVETRHRPRAGSIVDHVHNLLKQERKL
jgi:hypothetical protein